jgi:thiol-disulfide isomerase/thioredoxin
MVRTLLFSLLIFPALALCQNSYSLNDKVQNFSFNSTINNPSGLTSFTAIQSDIIILDFFGTWCVPCINALPHLKELQEKFKNKISILLLSNEKKARLEKFVTTRQPFPFPVVVDEENVITDLFSPPSYPYTIVINKERKIIALTDAAGLTEKMIEEWIKGEATVTPATQQPEKPKVMTAVNLASNNKLVQLSQEFMYAAKTGDSTDRFVLILKELSYDTLKISLQSDDEKKAFWINLYNGFTQVLLKQNPGSYKNRGRFFSSKQITIAGKQFSLDEIEHGILRRSKIKWSLGHMNKLFPGKTEKELRVNELDYRLHFALNCGAKSCPPIAFYNPENLNPQLELATNAYLQSETEYDAASNVLKLPAIMSWFRRDFGGKKKMIALLKDKKIIPQDVNPKIKFKSYDWTLYTNNYKN